MKKIHIEFIETDKEVLMVADGERIIDRRICLKEADAYANRLSAVKVDMLFRKFGFREWKFELNDGEVLNEYRNEFTRYNGNHKDALYLMELSGVHWDQDEMMHNAEMWAYSTYQHLLRTGIASEAATRLAVFNEYLRLLVSGSAPLQEEVEEILGIKISERFKNEQSKTKENKIDS